VTAYADTHGDALERAPVERAEQLDFFDYEQSGDLSSEEMVALQQAGFAGHDIYYTARIQEWQMAEMAWLEIEWITT
jgi:hypothetical protein